MTDTKLAVVVLAAGQGTRMKSAKPKVLHELAGIPMIGHVLAAAGELGAAHTLAVVRHGRDAVAAVVADLFADTVIVDQDEVAGTGRAVEVAVDALPTNFIGDVLVLSADVPLLDAATLAALLETHRSNRASGTVLTAIVDDPTGYGRVLRDADGGVQGIVEHKDASEAELEVSEVNSGTYIFSVAALRHHLPRLTTLNAQGEKYLTDVFGLLRAGGAIVSAVSVAEPWLVAGINDRVQLAEASARLNAMIVRGWQLAGVTVRDPGTTWIDLKAKLSEDVELLPGTQIRGATVIDTGATIGPDTTLIDCEVGEGAVIRRTDATLSVFGKGVTVGPYAYLRANTVLDDGVHVGTFVELKNSHIGRGSKVPHLSYVGDTTVGVESNIGAGSITANYDGVNKHRTTIGDHVRGSSHTVYVAPVSIGDGAYTGAGTVVRKDVPPGALAISVAPQRNMIGWVEVNRPGTAAAIAAAEAGIQDPERTQS